MQLAILYILLSTFWLTSPNWQTKVDPLLLEEFTINPEQEMIVLLNRQADLSYAEKLIPKKEKTRFVFNQLYYTAKKSQHDLVQWLQKQGNEQRSLFLINAVGTKGDYNLLATLAKRSDVKAIYANPDIPMELPIIEPKNTTLRNPAPEWGILEIQADKVWELGYRGQGITIGGQDTGYDWTHPNLQQQYRGYQRGQIQHDYNWYDAIHDFSPLHREAQNPCGLDSTIPCDDGFHGTHTMGTMVGTEGYGVAPAAQWIGVRNMERGYGNPFSYTEGFQWFLAPTDLNGQNPNPDLAPDVITNSWYCPELEGCNKGNRAMLEMAADNLRKAGIVVVVSAGNSGPECHTINEIPAAFPSAFAVGASDINHNIATFSARGPIYDIDSNYIVKPDIVAPGVRVRSTTPNGQFRNLSGTSMAGPHVAGAVALLLSAQPHLIGQVDEIEELFRISAQSYFSEQNCGPLRGSAHPNAVYGYGIINVKAALDSAARRSIDEQIPQTSLVYPNPNRGQFSLSLPSTRSDIVIQIHDLQGRQVYQQKVLAGPRIVELTLENLSAGVYILTYPGLDNLEPMRLVIQ
ncbi:MAG: S8/S53 family peptidase [Bacteroidota bacterium]